MTAASAGKMLELGPNRIAYVDPVGARDDRMAVVLVHGSSVHRAIWDPVIARLSEQFRPISFDHPGHGGSSLPAIASADALTDLLEALHAELAIARSVVIGVSLGGAIAQLFHARHPQRLAALGLISTAPNFALPADVVARWRADDIAYAEDEASLSVAPTASAAVRDRIGRLRRRVSAEGQAADLTACALWDYPVALDGIECPLLLMTASHDIARLKQQAEQWARDVSGSRLVEIADAGHFMLIEQPDACAEAILAWLQSIDAADQTAAADH